VFAAGTINWFWGVEREGVGNWGGIDLKTTVKPGVTLDQVVTAMTLNVMSKLQEGPGLPPATMEPDGGVSFGDGGSNGGNNNGGGNGANPDGSSGSSGGGCSATHAGSTRDGLLTLGALALAGAIVARRRK
jgi:hypothetical protein